MEMIKRFKGVMGTNEKDLNDTQAILNKVDKLAKDVDNLQKAISEELKKKRESTDGDTETNTE